MEKLAFSVQELARLVSLHPETIRRAIAAGELKAANSGGKTHYRISRADVLTWWQSRGGEGLFPDQPAARSEDRAAAIRAARGAMRRPGQTGDRTQQFLSEKHPAIEREEMARA